MHNINLQGLLRSGSIIIISLIVILYIGLIILIDDIFIESSNSQPRKEYEYRDSEKGMSIPDFSYNLESLFPKQLIPVIATTKLDSIPVVPVNIPSLQFVGMIETDDKIIYSFRNMDTKKLMLFEEGVILKGIILLTAEAAKYTFKKNKITFQVDKK